MQQEVMGELVRDMTNVDAGFKYAMTKVDFQKRRDGWNAAVDEYIVKKISLGDTRSDEDIARQCNVDANEPALWKRCAFPTFIVEEKAPGELKSCRIVYYCGRSCQSEHWPTHKKECGQDVKMKDIRYT
jgi:hypothetical protein